MTTARNPGKWQRVSRDHPCAICNKSDWCSFSADGTLAACRRVDVGCVKSKNDRTGVPYYLHRLDGAPREPSAPLPSQGGPTPERADPDTLQRVYDALLARLPLNSTHREALRRRGLADSEIDRRGYRTLPVQGRARIVRELGERFGDMLLRVPGIVTRERDGRRYLTLAGAAGLVVPVRDVAGRVAALLVRREEDGPGKYLWVSSAKDGGPGPGAPVHVPLGVVGPAEVVRVTEGALKADVAHALSGVPTVGLPGVSTWRPALPVLRQLDAKTVRLALDADARDKPAVARALEALAEGLAAAGLAVELERWPGEHKGIDDALAAGAAVEVLAGDAARQAIAAIVAEGTASEPLPEPSPLDRLPDVLATGGAPALFADRPLLAALASLKADDPAAYAGWRSRLKGLVSLPDLNAALKPYLRRQAQEASRLLLTEAGYRIEAGRICRERWTPDGGTVLVPLCNFTARITEVVTKDDGAEQTSRFTVAGDQPDGKFLPPVSVPAEEFAGLGWVTPAWHGEAVVYAGQGTRDHVRAAIEMLSRSRARRTVYAHTGWRLVGDAWHYLHAGGAVGPDGSCDVAVSLPDALAGFLLPAALAPVPLRAKIAFGDLAQAAQREADQLGHAVKASLDLLRLGPERLTFPLLAAVYRAVLGDTDFALHLAGPTGSYKSEAAALAQQHFGPSMDARHLPASWSSTGNALEGLAFAAKDALLVVDDFCPTGSTADVQRQHREADRLFRGQGNRSGRQRMRADATLRPAKPPRGLTLSTGEDVPRGQSLRARLLVLEVSRGDFGPQPPHPNPTLSACQKDAADGKYALALAGFLRWLAPQIAAVRARLRNDLAELRDQARGDGQHARTPGIVADLALGLRYFLDFAQAIDSITADERADLYKRGWAALGEAAARQAEHVQAAEPCSHFLGLLTAALASGRAHVAGPDGHEPKNPAAWGWREVTFGAGQYQRTDWQPRGDRIGWMEDGQLYLEPEASYAVAQALAGVQGEALAVSSRTLRRRLRERGHLASVAAEREVLTVRRTLEGKRREVLHLQGLSPCIGPDQPDQSPGNHGENGRVAGRVAGRVCPDPTSNPTSKPDQTTEENGELVGLVGLATGGGRPAGDNSATCNGTVKGGTWYDPGHEGERTPWDDDP
jgi:hypothetical protein